MKDLTLSNGSIIPVIINFSHSITFFFSFFFNSEIGSVTNVDNVTHVLAVCNTNGGFIFVLLGWEGFAVDSRVFKDVIS